MGTVRQASRGDDGRWTVSIDFEVRNKPLAEPTRKFDSIEQCKAFVADYLERPMREIKAKDFPKPDM